MGYSDVMNIENFDLNLLVCFDALMRERNVSRAAEQLNISQPAMSNSLKRLRGLLDDPLLVRTTRGMEPTERALELEPLVRQSLSFAEAALSPTDHFDPSSSQRVFRILVSDYVEGTLISSLVKYLQLHAPEITLDVLTLSDASFQDLEKGKVDLAINRFDNIPQSFYQRLVWEDSFSCLVNEGHPLISDNTLEKYLQSGHIWVSKTGIGVATGMSQENSHKRGWVDDALTALNCERKIRVFTRHYQIVPLLVSDTDLIVTLPTRAAHSYGSYKNLIVLDPPFEIKPIEIKMVWSPLLHHNSAHQWIRRTLIDLAKVDLAKADVAKGHL
ncbi:MAG: DNA-binding transcriptional LysR family regulator [Kiritimatiellia bacterium]|jgi:DNA-binding transcriptional LysR family regulator